MKKREVFISYSVSDEQKEMVVDGFVNIAVIILKNVLDKLDVKNKKNIYKIRVIKDLMKLANEEINKALQLLEAFEKEENEQL